MRLVIDFESYYDTEYSLGKMPTHQYIRDPRWKCLGCGLKIDDEPPFYLAGVGELEYFFGTLNWSLVTAVAHNAQFDGSVLWEHFGKRAPRTWIDTMLLARWAISQGHLSPDMTTSLWALAPLVGMQKGDTAAAVAAGGQQLADYGVDDVIIEDKLLRVLMGFKPPRDELMYMDQHVRMATEPVLDIDVPMLEEVAKSDPREEAFKKILRKDANFKVLLEKNGIVPEYKTTPTGRTKMALAKTDVFMQSLTKHPNIKVRRLAEMRLGSASNLVRTRAQRFLNVGAPLPVPLLYYAAGPGRSGGQDSSNMQNLPRKGPLRHAVKAPEGHKLIVGDSRQVEARTVGWRAGDKKLLTAFGTTDPYRTFAGHFMYGKAPEDVTADERFMGKAGMLGLGFAQSAYGFQEGIRAKDDKHVPIETCKLGHKAYREGFDQVPKWWKAVFQNAIRDGELTLPSGRKLIYPDLTSEVKPFTFMDAETDTWVTKDMRQYEYTRPKIFSGRGSQRKTVNFWKGLATENDTQATARDIVFWQLRHCADEGRSTGKWKMVWMTHDEGVFVAKEGEDTTLCAERLAYWLTQNPSWAHGLPLEGEVKIGQAYGDCK